jgi:hypothetical protein
MRAGIALPGIKVHDGFICDGHHRFIASGLADASIDYYPGVLSNNHLKTRWDEMIIDEEDWDTLQKIRMLNEQDAAFNRMTFVELLELLSKI